ncbi:hypothetical protein [Helicobacter suis]|uniref:hypothetical protein n=1 Tax=Helicobacter suis TaxID=104628 RepID=UPI001F082C42|nr:hypothetical protein [Helicobacter suis]
MLNNWLEEFGTKVLAYSGLIMSGNTLDLQFSRHGKLIPFNKVLEDALLHLHEWSTASQGFVHVVFYSLALGIQGIDLKTWEQIKGTRSPNEEAYDIGDQQEKQTNPTAIKVPEE